MVHITVCVCSEYRPELPAGKHSQFAIEHGPVEIVDLPSYKIVDPSSSQTVGLPEATMNIPASRLLTPLEAPNPACFVKSTPKTDR